MVKIQIAIIFFLAIAAQFVNGYFSRIRLVERHIPDIIEIQKTEKAKRQTFNDYQQSDRLVKRYKVRNRIVGAYNAIRYGKRANVNEALDEAKRQTYDYQQPNTLIKRYNVRNRVVGAYNAIRYGKRAYVNEALDEFYLPGYKGTDYTLSKLTKRSFNAPTSRFENNKIAISEKPVYIRSLVDGLDILFLD